MRFILIIAFVAVIALPCCKQAPNSVPANMESLATTYAELLVLNQRYTLAMDSLSADRYDSEYLEILRRNNYTREQYFSELESMTQSPGSYKLFCDRALAKLQEMKKSANGQDTKGRS
ncbi:MAG TPA: hypothetical protein VI758_10005 [Bacteroidota bacterium]